MTADTDLTVLPPRFWAKVDTSGGSDACWPWTASLSKPNGYGMFGIIRHGRKRVAHAHRLVLAASLGRALGPTEEACHTCDNPPCANRAHLYLGTRRTNALDAFTRFRNRPPRACLTPDQAQAIMWRLRVGGETKVAIARAFGVSESTVADIAHGRSWSHLGHGAR